MAAYSELVANTVPARQAAALTGVSRATAHRKHNSRPTAEREQVTPVNKLSPAEIPRLLDTLNDNRFVDLAPLQIYANLLDEGTHLCSVSTTYRTLAAHKQVNQRRR
jgi:putative transposase